MNKEIDQITSIKKWASDIAFKKPLIKRFRYQLSTLYIPSRTNFLIISAIIAVFFSFAIKPVNQSVTSWLLYLLSDIGIDISFLVLNLGTIKNQSDLIAIHAGIATIIFALIIFIAESLRDENMRDEARVLLKVSNLYSLVLIEIIVFFFFFPLNYIAYFAVLFVGFFLFIHFQG